MKRCSRNSVVVLFLAFVIGASAAVPASGATAEPISREAPILGREVPALIQTAPDFSTYPDLDGVVWLKRIEYRMASGGGVERLSSWILLGRTGLPSRWLNWSIPVPTGGTAEIVEASVYEPGSSQKIKDVTPTTFRQEGFEAQRIDFTGLPDEFILVLAYKEHFPGELSIDDLVWVSETLPVWEMILNVAVPKDYPFYYASNLDIEPETSLQDGKQFHEWRQINVVPESLRSLRTDSRRYAAFGTREGQGAAARLLRNAESVKTPEPPASVKNIPNRRGGAKEIEELLLWVYRQPLSPLPEGTRRGIPSEAPWTRREKVFIAYRWLKSLGVDVNLCWQLPYRPAGDLPVFQALADNPVLEIPGADKKSHFYCNMQLPPRFGESAVDLWERPLYSVGAEDKVDERKVVGSSAGENRFVATFNLRLDKEGMVGGNLRLQLRNGWRRLLLPPEPTSEDLGDFVERLFPTALRNDGITLKQTRTETEIDIALSGIQAIKGTGGRNILMTMPPLIPRWFESIASGPFPYTLHFPFTMEARVNIALPSSTANVIMPTASDPEQGSRKIKYSDSYKLSRKKILTAEARLTVGTTAIKDAEATQLRGALQKWHLFMTKSLPVQLKVK